MNELSLVSQANSKSADEIALRADDFVPTGLLPIEPSQSQSILTALAHLPRADSGSATDYQMSDEAKAQKWLFERSRQNTEHWSEQELQQYQIALEVLAANVLANHGRSDHTNKALKQNWRHFVVFCRENSFPALPASQVAITAYLEKMTHQPVYAERQRSSDQPPSPTEVLKLSTIKMRLWAISTLHTQIGLLDPISDPATTRLIDKLGRQRTQLHGEKKQAAPFRAEDLSLLVKIYRQGTRVQQRDLALLAVALCTMLRESELTALEFRDFRPLPDGSAQIQIRATKTSTHGEIAYSVIPANVMLLINEYMQAIGLSWHDSTLQQPGQLIFRKATNPNAKAYRIAQRSTELKPLSNVTVDKIFASAHKILSEHHPFRYLTISKWSGHSARVGGLYDLILIKKEDITVAMLNGRWKRADMPAYYGRKIKQDSIGVASLIASLDF